LVGSVEGTVVLTSSRAIIGDGQDHEHQVTIIQVDHDHAFNVSDKLGAPRKGDLVLIAWIPGNPRPVVIGSLVQITV
jgi:hypothetical protein